MKLLRTIRLDPSDTFVFEQAAEPGEWAVPGSFVFWNQDPSAFEGKKRTAFRAGLLGIGSPRPGRPPRSLGGGPLCALTLRSSGRYADRGASRAGRRFDPRNLPHAAPA